jgi:hypothetical protein
MFLNNSIINFLGFKILGNMQNLMKERLKLFVQKEAIFAISLYLRR